jgi:hypothetical protein
MVLALHSDASYLLEANACSRAGGPRGQWPAWRQQWQLSKSAVLVAAVAALWRWHCGGGGQLGGGGGSLAKVQLWRQGQCINKYGGSAAAAAATQRWQQQRGVGGSSSSGGSMAGSTVVAGEGRDALSMY